MLIAGPNRAPEFDAVGPLTVMPGGVLEVPLVATDPDGDRVTFSLAPDGPLPTGMLHGNGTLMFNPTPSEIGSYEFDLIATDGALQSTQTVMLNVVADPITTTRISGVVLNADNAPLPGIPVELGNLQTVTAADGSFVIDSGTGGPLPDDTLKIRGEAFAGPDVYPFIAEKLPLLLGRDANFSKEKRRRPTTKT